MAMSGGAAVDSEEDDSDYVQDETAGDDEEEEDQEEEAEDSLGAATTERQKSKIDDIWASMNATDASVPGEEAAEGNGMAGKSKGKAKKKKKANKKANKVLAGIFGKKAASRIVSGVGKAKRRGVALDGAARKKLLAASRKVEVSEVKKYAGKDIVVKRTVTAESAEHAAAAASKKKKGGLDDVLAAIDGPKSISTVTKSSMDWETYKAAEGIEGEMEQVTKEGKGYLNKQDFLQRCDVRKFETELEARQSKRDA